MPNLTTTLGSARGSIKGQVRAAICIGAFASLMPLAASAISVTQNGADYTVSVASVGGFVYDVTYLADFTDFTNSSQQQFVSGINFKFSGGPDLVSAVLQSAPGNTGFWTTTINDNLSGSDIGCEGAQGGSDFVCSGITLEANYGTAPTQPNNPGPGPTYEWVVRVTMSGLLAPSVITDPENPIRAQFIKYECKTTGGGGGSNTKKKTSTPATETCEWKGAGLMSLNGPFVDCTDGKCEPPDERVPEPGTLALLGLGLLGLSAVRRKRL